MGWFERFKKPKEPEKKATKIKVVTPYCEKCSLEIECLDVSIGDVIEDQGAFLYSGSEGHLYEPIYDGVICVSCGSLLCDRCHQELVDKLRCPKCGGTLRHITPHLLPKAG